MKNARIFNNSLNYFRYSNNIKNILKKCKANSFNNKFNNILYTKYKSFCTTVQDDLEFKNADIIKFTYKYNNDNSEVKVEAPEGMNLLKAAHKNNIDLEGACDCSLACSTCHVILEQEIFDSIPPADENEDDLLDNAFGLSHTSRLGCQVKLTKQFNGCVIKIPSATRNLYVDGYKPQPH